MPIAAENLDHFLNMQSVVNLGGESSTVSIKAQTFSSSSSGEDCDDITIPSTFASGIHCNGCGFEIKEKYMMKIDDNCWHENCLICSNCRIPLNGSSCYSRSGQFYCKEDYIVKRDDSLRRSNAAARFAVNDVLLQLQNCHIDKHNVTKDLRR